MRIKILILFIRGRFFNVTCHTIVNIGCPWVQSRGDRKKKKLCKSGENSFGNNKIGTQFPTPTQRENFLGVGALTPRHSPLSKN